MAVSLSNMPFASAFALAPPRNVFSAVLVTGLLSRPSHPATLTRCAGETLDKVCRRNQALKPQGPRPGLPAASSLLPRRVVLPSNPPRLLHVQLPWRGSSGVGGPHRPHALLTPWDDSGVVGWRGFNSLRETGRSGGARQGSRARGSGDVESAGWLRCRGWEAERSSQLQPRPRQTATHLQYPGGGQKRAAPCTSARRAASRSKRCLTCGGT